MEIITKSVIRCPHCNYEKENQMPVDACQYFYQCENCKSVLKPKPGDCCVFCSYGDTPCPSVQRQRESESDQQGKGLAVP